MLQQGEKSLLIEIKSVWFLFISFLNTFSRSHFSYLALPSNTKHSSKKAISKVPGAKKFLPDMIFHASEFSNFVNNIVIDTLCSDNKKWQRIEAGNEAEKWKRYWYVTDSRGVHCSKNTMAKKRMTALRLLK